MTLKMKWLLISRYLKFQITWLRISRMNRTTITKASIINLLWEIFQKSKNHARLLMIQNRSDPKWQIFSQDSLMCSLVKIMSSPYRNSTHSHNFHPIRRIQLRKKYSRIKTNETNKSRKRIIIVIKKIIRIIQ